MNCNHAKAYVVRQELNPETCVGYFDIYCPDCRAAWPERSRGCKYEWPEQMKHEEQFQVVTEAVGVAGVTQVTVSDLLGRVETLRSDIDNIQHAVVGLNDGYALKPDTSDYPISIRVLSAELNRRRSQLDTLLKQHVILSD
jgi:hypothetical protein